MSKTKGNETLISILNRMVESNTAVAEELKATREVLKDLLSKLIEKEAPINVEVKVPGLAELKNEIDKVRRATYGKGGLP